MSLHSIMAVVTSLTGGIYPSGVSGITYLFEVHALHLIFHITKIYFDFWIVTGMFAIHIAELKNKIIYFADKTIMVLFSP